MGPPRVQRITGGGGKNSALVFVPCEGTLARNFENLRLNMSAQVTQHTKKEERSFGSKHTKEELLAQ